MVFWGLTQCSGQGISTSKTALTPEVHTFHQEYPSEAILTNSLLHPPENWYCVSPVLEILLPHLAFFWLTRKSDSVEPNHFPFNLNDLLWFGGIINFNSMLNIKTHYSQLGHASESSAGGPWHLLYSPIGANKVSISHHWGKQSVDGGGSVRKGISQEKVKVHLSTSSIRHRLLCHREIIASVWERSHCMGV